MADGDGDVTIKVKHEDGTPMEVPISLGDSLAEAIELCGEEVVYWNYVKGARAQARNTLSQASHGTDKRTPQSPADAMAKLDNWVPRKPAERTARDPVEEVVALFAKSDEAGKAALLERLKALRNA